MSITEQGDTITLKLVIDVSNPHWYVNDIEDESAKGLDTYVINKRNYSAGQHVAKVVAWLDLLGNGDAQQVSDSHVFTIDADFGQEGPSIFALPITSGSDDAEERPNGNISHNSSALEMSFDLGRAVEEQQQTVGLRFDGVSLDRSVTIRRAYLEFTIDGINADEAALSIKLQDSANAAPIGTANYELSQRATIGSIEWKPQAWTRVGERVRTPDVSTLIQSIVNRPDWSPGNAMLFTISGTGTRTAESYDGNPGQAAKLYIEFEANNETTDSSLPENENELTFPVRAAFYYPWFPETWTVGGAQVFYQPMMGYYRSDSSSVVDAHIQAMDYAKINVGIFSWWGVGTHDEATRIPLLLDRTNAATSPLKWAAYYEQEGFGHPSREQIGTELNYIKQQYAQRPQYAHIAGKPVIFVYNADDTDCGIADKWAPFFTDWYVVLKVFPGYSDCRNQPASWHQYSPANPTDQQAGYSYTISPGFWRADEAGPRLARNLARWKQDIQNMLSSDEPWQLITTFNEWGEGTAIEHAADWQSSQQGDFLDALHNDGVPSTSPGLPPRPPGELVYFGTAGDFGGKDDRAGTVMTDMLTRNLSAFFLLGDVSYSEIVPEQAWCDWAHGYLGSTYPLQLVAGNHEEDSRVDGHILNFAACMPDRLSSDLGPGGYSVNYASDLGPVTFIATSPDLVVDGVDYRYRAGSTERAWLVNAIGQARAEGDWVVVGMHKNCITIGNKSCEIGQEFAQLLIDVGVDLVLQGHDHDYQRSHALRTVVEGSVGSIGDDGSDGAYVRSSGTVFVIVGTAGRSMTSCSHADSEYGNFTTHWCGEEATDTKGYLVLAANQNQLDAQFVTTRGTAFVDQFTITR